MPLALVTMVIALKNKFKFIKPFSVVIIDDLIATGGTLGAAEALVAQTEAKLLGSLCLIEIDFLEGKKKAKAPFCSLIHV